jgi:hypothetical protein
LTLWLFLLLQTFDGLFTYAAIRAYGVIAEGNVLLATWIALVGPGAALMGAKSLAGMCGVFLYTVGQRAVLLVLTLVYAIVAIGPWLLIFNQH